MGTCSYVLTGTQQGMLETFGSTCHGAVSSLYDFTQINYYNILYIYIFLYIKRKILKLLTLFFREELCREQNQEET